MKKISVLMSTYNEKISDLELSINSILNQTYNNFEFIIVLDNPNNLEITEYILKKQQQDSRIIIIKNAENEGLANSLNKALIKSTGEYIARMDADDISITERFRKQIEFLEKNKDYDVVASNRKDIDEFGKGLQTAHIVCNSGELVNKALIYFNIITHPTVMMRREAIVNVGGYRDFKAAQDYDLWLRMIKRGSKFYILPDVLLEYRIRMESISRSNTSKQHSYTLYARYLYNNEKNGENLFSEDEYEKFLKRKKMYTAQEQNKYKLAHETLFLQKDKGGIKKMVNMIRALFLNRTIFEYWLISKKRDRLLCDNIIMDDSIVK